MARRRRLGRACGAALCALALAATAVASASNARPNQAGSRASLAAAVLGTEATGAPGTFTPVTPTRLLDTRIGQGGQAPPAAQQIGLQVRGVGPVPSSGVSAVALNVTVAAPGAGGYVTVYPGGTNRPLASNLNFVKNQTVPNMVVVPLGSDGKVELYNAANARIQLIVDVFGYYVSGTASVPGAFTALSPTRLLDTRTGRVAATPAGGATVRLPVAGHGGVPATGVSAVVVNVTATASQAPGYVTVYGYGARRPTTSNLNFPAGRTVPNLVVAPLGAGGSLALYNGSSGRTQLIVDVAGYYRSGTVTTPGAFVPLAPARLLDTRTSGGRVRPRGSLPLQISGRGGVPSSGAGAVVLNVTVTGPYAPGYVSVYADGGLVPTVSNVNFAKGQTVPNLVVAPVAANGRVDLYNGSPGSTNLVADIEGYFLPRPATGELAGTVTAGGAGLPHAVVYLFTAYGAQAAMLTTDGQGRYNVPGLPPGRYRACIDASMVANAPPGGYLNECTNDVYWYPGSAEPPQNAAAVEVTAAVRTTGVDVALGAGAGLAGTVTASGTSRALSDVAVYVVASTGRIAATSATARDGTYSFTGLRSGAYTVCFDASLAPGGPYGSECYADVAWNADPAAFPGTATAVTLTGGAVRSGVDAALAAG